jgi:glycosyltransferase involved in cell wall biosynthesis
MPSLENDTTRNIVPMKVYEYLAAGKPLVASHLPGMLAEFGSNSGIIYADTPLQVLDKALNLDKSPKLVKQLSLDGRHFAEQNADWEKTADQFEAILVSLQNKNSARRKSNATSLSE